MSSPTPFATPNCFPDTPYARPVWWASLRRRSHRSRELEGQADVLRPTAKLMPRRRPYIEFGRFSVGASASSAEPRRDQLPEAAQRDLGLDGDHHEAPEWDLRLPFFLQAGFDRRR